MCWRMKAVLAALVVLLGSSGWGQAWARTETAVFAGGCFWCLERDMEGLAGVVSAESGYTGGRERNPTYRQVSFEQTGHYEAVRVRFDPDKISYRALVDRFWTFIDPTDSGGQFCDRGPSYRTAIFATPTQQGEAQASKAALKQLRAITPILPAETFWPAEDYHQDYAKKNPIRYKLYRTSCGRDARLREVWGGKP